MKTYKKGISLIVLVITVIVLAILATTVIISLSNTNIIGEAKDAVQKNNLKAYEEQATLAYASWKMDNKSANLTNIADLEEYGFNSSELPSGYIAYVKNGVPKITIGSVWDGSYPTDTTTFILSGEGTEASPYLINSASDFAFLCSYVNVGNNMDGKYIKLTTDIDLAGKSWTPIGTETNVFAGNFDGNNKTLYNININVESGYAALFAHVGFNYDLKGSIKNLTISGGSISGQSAAGFFGVANNGTTFSNLKNDNVTITGRGSAGGIGNYGYLENVIDSCENTGTIIGTSSSSYVGGIIPFIDLGGVVKNSVNYGNVTGGEASGIGYLSAGCSVQNCINYGNIHGKSSADAIALVSEYADGVTNCTNYGTITVDEGGTLTNNANVNM